MTPHSRKLGPGLATMLVAGSMIGSGVYLLPASLGAIGSISLLGWLGALAAALIYGAMFAWLGTLYPGSGGFLANIQTAFGRRTAFVAGGLYWVQGLLGNVAIALAVTGYLTVLFPVLRDQFAAMLCTISVIWVFVLANLAGARAIGRLEGMALAVGLVPVLLVGTLGWLYFDPQTFAQSWNVSGKPALTVVPGTIVLVLWAFLGLESACIASDLVDNPRRNVPIATIGGVLVAAVVYLAACTAVTGILPAATLARSTAPFADVTSAIFGASFGTIVAVCAAFKATGTLGGWILLTSESARLADAIDRPARATDSGPSRRNFILSGLLMTGVIIATSNPSISSQFAMMANAVVVVMICVYATAGASLMRLSMITGNATSGNQTSRIPQILGGLSVLLSIAIVATQGPITLGCTAIVVLATVGLHTLRSKVRPLSLKSI